MLLQFIESRDVHLRLFLSEQPPEDEIPIPAAETCDKATEWVSFWVGDEQDNEEELDVVEKQHFTLLGLLSHRPLMYKLSGQRAVSTHWLIFLQSLT